mgnify:CR=1 FL=1
MEGVLFQKKKTMWENQTYHSFLHFSITWVQCVILAFSEYYVQKHERGDRALILPWVHFIDTSTNRKI